LIAYRVKHGEDLKLEHDYYERTYANRQRKLLEPKLATARDDQPEEPTAPDPVAHLVFDPSAAIPFHEVDAVSAAQPQFLRALGRVRRAGENPNTNFAAECQRLANYALVAGKTDQWILNLLVSLHTAGGYSNDLDYFQNVIRQAHDAADALREDERVKKILAQKDGDQPEQPDQQPNPSADSAPADQTQPGAQAGAQAGDQPQTATRPVAAGKIHAARAKLRALFGFDMRIEWIQTPDPTYLLYAANGLAPLANISDLIDQNKLRRHLAESTGVYLPKTKNWAKVAQLLLDAREPVSGGSDRIETTSEHMSRYLASTTIHRSLEDADASKDPFVREGYVWVHSQGWQTWLRKDQDILLSQQQVTAQLRLIGARAALEVNEDLRIRGKRRSYWRLPADWTPQAEVSDK
jgi:hypothetical protein